MSKTLWTKNYTLLFFASACGCAGGIAGGMSNGNTIVFRIAVKATPSIALEQMTVDKNNNAVKCSIHGRHDPCLCPRMVPVVEAMSAIVLADMMLRNQSARF